MAARKQALKIATNAPKLIDDLSDRLRDSGSKVGSEPLGYWGIPAQRNNHAYLKLAPIFVWNTKDKNGMIHLAVSEVWLREEDWVIRSARLGCDRRIRYEDWIDADDDWVGCPPLVPKGTTVRHQIPNRLWCAHCERDHLLRVAQSNAITEVRRSFQDHGMEGGPVSLIFWSTDMLFGFRDNNGVYQPYNNEPAAQVQTHILEAGISSEHDDVESGEPNDEDTDTEVQLEEVDEPEPDAEDKEP